MTIATHFPVESRIHQSLLLATLVLLGYGLFLPIVTLTKFILLENTFSVYSGVVQLLKEGQLFLFVLITGFSIVLPALKIVMLFILVSLKNSPAQRFDRYLRWMHAYGKWSMLDVFVVAVLVVSVKLGAIASVEIRYGLYFFAAVVVLTMLITARVSHLANRVSAGA